MKRLTAFARLILKQPDAGAVCTGNDRREGPVGTAIVSRLSDSYSLRGHAALHHGISDHTADRQRSTDSIRFQIKQALQRAQKEQIENEGQEKSYGAKPNSEHKMH